ncbi:MAG: hypothetical protein GY715_12440 [Planctomycetes bacterium]|nr:hypothetical protein [Planctomycetota bacterium]
MRRVWCGWCALFASALLGLDVLATQTADPAAVAPPAADEPVTIRFNFKGASFEQVLDFFSRTTGLPVVWETTAPGGTLDYLSPEAYELPEALRVLNIILQSKGVMLRLDDGLLYLQKLTEMQKEDIPTYIGEVPAGVTDDQIVTLVRQLGAATAAPLAEKLKTMVAAYGSVTALEQQNAIVITETAAQVRRLAQIIAEVDRAAPDDTIEFIKVRHAKPSELMEPLKALLSRRVESYVLDKKNKPKKVVKNEMSGLNISADDRTGVIIAKGLQNRINQLRETLRLLDVPGGGASRTTRTFALARLGAADAATTLTKLFEKIPEAERPTVIPFEDRGRVTVVGSAANVEEAAQLLAEIDGGGGGDTETVLVAIPLEHADPQAVMAATTGLLTRGQRSVVKILVGADRASLVVSGPPRDVEAVVAIVPVLDVARRVDREVRIVRLTSGDPADTLRRTRKLYDLQVEAAGTTDDPARELRADLDGEGRTLTLIGAKEAIEAFVSAMRTVESNTIVDRETRQIDVAHVDAGGIVAPLTALAGQLMTPRDGTAYVAPTIEPVDALDLLIVTALPSQFAVLESLVETLDVPDPADFRFRVVSLAGVTDVEMLLDRVDDAWERLAQGYADGEMPAPEIEHDAVTGNLVVSGRARAVALYEQALTETRRLLPPARSGRMITLRQARAGDVAEPLRELWERTAADDPARTVPDPEIDVIDHTNSLYVVAEEAQHQVIARYVQQLDRFEPTELPPLRLMQVRAADAAQIADLLRRRYDARPPEQRRETPVTVDADTATNTLIVTAHEDAFREIREFVDGVNQSGDARAERQTLIFPLQRARATDLATALEKLYPEPPMPLDRRGRPMPHLREPREVYVSADAATNTLIIEAPGERQASFEALLEQLDRVELPPRAQLRTYHIERGDPALIARTLTELARRGVLSEQPPDGSKPVDVQITAEPASRTLIVAGDETTFQQTEEILGDLEIVPVQRTLRVFDVTGVDPEVIADRAVRLYDEQTAQIPGARSVSVEVDRERGTVLAIADDEAMFVFAAIMAQLQQAIGPAPDVRLIPLEFADATEVVGYLDDLKTSHVALAGNFTGAPPMFQVIERTNSILVAAQPQHHEIVTALIRELDRNEPKEMPPLRILRLRTADAANLATALMRQYNQRPIDERNEKPISIAADAQTNALIVAAHDDLIGEIETIVSDLNAAGRMDTEGREIRIFPLRVARAEELARTIDTMYPEPPMPMDRRGRPMPHLREGREVVVRADVQTNAIIVDAPVQRMAGFEQLVEQLDRQKLGEESEIRTYEIRHASLEALAATLRDLAQTGALSPSGQDRRSPVLVTTEPVSQKLVVSGSSVIFERVEQVLEELDVKRTGPASTLRFFRLEHARAETLAPVLGELLAGEQVRGSGQTPQATEPVRVAADPRLNAVVVSGPTAVLNIADEMIAQLDVDPTGFAGRARSLRVVVVENADATELASSLEALFTEDAAGGVPPSFRVDAASNSLLVRATDDQFQTIEEVVRQIDRATIVSTRQMRMLPIDPSKATAADIARSLKQMLDNSGGARIQIISLDELLEGRKKEPRDAEEGAPSGASSARPPGVTGRWMTMLAAAVTAAPTTSPRRGERSASGSEPGEGRTSADAGPHLPRPEGEAILSRSAGEGSLVAAADPAPDAVSALRTALETSGDLTIAIDPATNSLVVVGSPRAIQRLAEFAEQLQEQIPAAPGRVRYVALPRETDARTLARLVDQTMRLITPVGGERGELRSRASVLPDVANNALIITCTDGDFETIGSLVAALAQPLPPEQVMVKVYQLQTVTADRAAASVRDLIAPAAPRRGRGRAAEQVREMAVTLLDGDRTIDGVFNPAKIRVTADQPTNSIVVRGPEEAIGFIDRYIEMIDQAPVNVRSTLKLFPLQHARARDLQGMLRNIFRARFQSTRRRSGPQPIQPEFTSDNRTNTLLVTASPEQLVEVEDLLGDLDRELGDAVHPLRLVELTAARPSQVARILDNVVVGSDQERRTTTMIVPDDGSGMLLVRADAAVNAEIDRVLAEIDRDAAGGFAVRTITLERADAQAVAGALQRFFDDRSRIASSGRGRRGQSRRVSIVGDAASSTLLVAASDADFEEIAKLVAQFDSPQATQAWSFRVFTLEHAKATEIHETVQAMVNILDWNQGPSFWNFNRRGGGGRANRNRGTLAVRAEPRLNAIIATGEGDKFALVENLIEILDVPIAEGSGQFVRMYPVRNAEIDLVADVTRELFTKPRRWWEDPDPDEIKIRVDRASRTLIVSADEREHEEIAAVIAGIDDELATPDTEVAVLPIEFADARDVERTLTSFLRDRARAAGRRRPDASVIASASANSIVVSASAGEMATLRDLLRQLDQADVSGDRVVEIIALAQGDAEEIGRILREQFGRRGGTGVVVTTDSRTNSLIINGPRQQYAQVRALVDQLDRPRASDETIIRTYALEGAQADEAVRILSSTLQLDARGETEGVTIKLDEETPAVEVKAQITADPRSNSVIVTATSESLPVIEQLIRQIDDVPAVSPVEYRIIPLDHAMADDVSLTLRLVGAWRDGPGPEPNFDYNRIENQLIVAATADQFEQIAKIVSELDQPSQRERVTDFVPLQYAEAEQVAEALEVFYGVRAFEADTPGKRNTRIVADPATNSLVITADESEWDGIRALLSKLDSEEYDASLQLEVIPLVYADARSVARAINDAFQGRIERDRRQERARERGRQTGGGGGEDDRREPVTPSVLVEAEEWVGASAEVQTNSVIVSANRQNIRKILDIVERLDVADFARLPAPRLIPVGAGDPIQLARSLTELYEQERGDRQGVRIVGDVASSTLVVRAADEEFEQIAVLAEALQQQASDAGLTVRIISLVTAPALRVADAMREAYAARAEQANLPLSIQVDAAGNNLVVASTAALIDEVAETAEQLDRLAPAAGQGIFIIELEHISPDAARSVIETIGLHRPPARDTTSRLVTEPIKVSNLRGRNAIIVIANPADRDTIIGLVKAIDVEPALADSEMRVVPLRNADARALAQILQQVLSPTDQQANTSLARAVQEQVRRLSVHRGGLNEPDLHLDLTKPVRVIADPAMNALVLSSTVENLDALVELVAMFDTLPIAGAVTVQLFPLENIAAQQFLRITRDLFSQGKELGQIPGSSVQGVPVGMVGKALFEEIALSSDERTNTVIVAGSEDAVALVEVLKQRLDAEMAMGWVEPRLLRLRFADATDLADMLDAIIVRGMTEAPQSSPLQTQVGRLRMARMEGGEGRVLESDVFHPMSRLVIRPSEQLNALILIGSPVNLDIVSELVSMLDVEAASPDATVRIYPVKNASAARLQSTITRLFDQQVRSKAIRPEDRVIVEADQRTNSLIVTTSPRSFAVLEGLLASLDTEVAPDVREIRRIEITNASAERLALFIQELMDARLDRLRTTQPETAELERATIMADSRSNSLVIVAGDESYAVIERLAADLDQSTLSELGLVEVLAVHKGNIDRIAEAVDAVMERRYADMPAKIRDAQKPLVLTDPRTNSLLVAANQEDLTAIRNLLEQLEAAPLHPAVGLHVIELPFSASAESLAPRLQRLMRERQQSLGEGRRPSDRVSVEPDPVGNTLIVAASAENREIVDQLLDLLMKAGSETIAGRVFEVIPVTSSRASDLVDLLDDLYVKEANRVRGPDAVRVTADERLNAVLVNADKQDVVALRDLIDELDGSQPAVVVEIKYLPLQSADAAETVGLIEDILSGRGIGARAGSEQATVVKYLRQLVADEDGVVPPRDAETEIEQIEVSAAIRESIVLTPDVRTNTVIVSAPQPAMAMLEQMILDIDSTTTGSKNIAIFKLVNADATAMAEILVDLFNLRQGRDELVLKPREDGMLGPGSVDLESTDLTAVPDQRQQLSITVDSRTNSLLVSGTPMYLDLVAEVVEELDALEANERQTYVYKLMNAQALEVARVLGEFVREEQEKLIGTLSPDQIGSAARLLEREITIQGDESSNSVLISASPRYMDRVKQMVREIDVDPPQVLIQVMLAEVTLDATDDWGVNLDAIFRTGSAVVSGGFALGTPLLGVPGVPNIQVAGTDFDMLIRAIQEQGRLAVLSNPSVMVANNQTARIQVGETIRVASTSNITESGNTNTGTEEKEVGTILQVTPSINPDGFVRLSVEPEISNLTNRTTQISENLEAPIITVRTANTTVTVRDGQTIVIGGLISDRFERRVSKVPFFGDIPLVGALFRSESENSARIELMIVLTPHVIDSPTNAARVEQVTNDEIDRLTLPERVKEKIRQGSFDLSGGLFDAQGNPVKMDIGPGGANEE